MVQLRQTIKHLPEPSFPVKNVKKSSDEFYPQSKPKKLTGYILWSIEERKSLSQIEGLSSQNLMQILGKRWTNLSDDIKLKWNTLAKEESKPTENKIKEISRLKRTINDDNIKNKKGKNKKY